MNDNKPIYKCELCVYKCKKFNTLFRHSLLKHNIQIDDVDKYNLDNAVIHFNQQTSNIEDNECLKKIENNITNNICYCGKKYKYKYNLYKHQKKCNIYQKFNILNNDNIHLNNKSIIDHYTSNNNNKLNNNINNSAAQIEQLTNLVHLLIKENKDIQKQMLELCKQPKITNNNNNNNNIQNLNIINYLNTECKDAMNLTDFVNAMTITFADLLQIKNHDMVYGFKNTFIKSLKDMEHKKRPIHCVDKKRRKFYVKEQNEWDKDEEHQKILKAINKITNKHYDTLQSWKKDNPDWLDDDDKQDNANKITTKLSAIYNDNDKSKVIKELSELYIKKE
jgi:hypothetical protein